MERTLVRDLAGREGCLVRVCGWAQEPLDAGLVLRDHTGLVALVGHDDLPAVTPESAVDATGTVVVGPDGLQLDVTELLVVGAALAAPPVDERSPLDDRLDWRYLDLRQPRNRLVFEVQTTVERAMREWWADRGFLELHSPKLRATPNRSGRELFAVDYFDRRAYLAQSPQFYKQMAMCAGFERVFEIGPVFRANPLLTSRHDTEFISVDVEVSWIESHEDLMAMEENWLAHVLTAVAQDHGAEVERLFARTVRIPRIPFPRVSMVEAHEILAAKGHRSMPRSGGRSGPEKPKGDIDAEGERLLAEHVAAERDHELVFVTEYPEAVRPFYHMRLDDHSTLTRSFDLLWNGLEVTTGAQREHRHDRLVAQAAARSADIDPIRSYLDFFTHGCPPHGGFGLGLTRLLMALLGVDDVREVTFLPRDPRRLSP